MPEKAEKSKLSKMVEGLRKLFDTPAGAAITKGIKKRKMKGLLMDKKKARVRKNPNLK